MYILDGVIMQIEQRSPRENTLEFLAMTEITNSKPTSAQISLEDLEVLESIGWLENESSQKPFIELITINLRQGC